MSTTLSHPFRLDANGQVATVPEGSPRHAAELAGHVLACIVGERPLAPDYGMPDPSGIGMDSATVAAIVSTCEPELEVTGVTVTDDNAGGSTISVAVNWTQS